MSPTAPGPRSRAQWRTAARVLVGGVDSPVRSFRGVGGTPVFFARGRGAYLVDVDGRPYLDLVSSWGANLLGNAPPSVVSAVRQSAAEGSRSAPRRPSSTNWPSAYVGPHPSSNVFGSSARARRRS